jgi:hypothetical protein
VRIRIVRPRIRQNEADATGSESTTLVPTVLEFVGKKESKTGSEGKKRPHIYDLVELWSPCLEVAAGNVKEGEQQLQLHLRLQVLHKTSKLKKKS